MFYVEMAGLLVKVENHYDYLAEVSREYMVEPTREHDAIIAATDEDIRFSLDWHLKHDHEEVDPGFAEYTQAHQKLYAQIAKYDAFWMHAAVIGMDGAAYGFTGPSGYGKSTHAHLWQKVYGERARIINGDNPIIRKREGVFYAYGTPFGGKHGENVNIGLPMKGYCFLNHGETNKIEAMDKKEARNRIFADMFDFRTVRRSNAAKILTLVEEFTEQVPMYLLTCNMEEDAARVAYEGMR